jgi:hypothetical protein
MPKNSKKAQPARQAADDPKLYAHAYAARLARHVAEELGPSRAPTRRRKKASPAKGA